jgi:hypothetical protein
MGRPETVKARLRGPEALDNPAFLTLAGTGGHGLT